MRKVFVLVALGAVGALLTGNAGAASFKGVVVAKDGKRKAVVTASAGTVRTVRASGRFARLQVGERIAVRASRLADGTFRAGSVRAAGRLKKVRFNAVVVKFESSRLIVAAGGSVFALRLRGVGTASTRNDENGLEAGDEVNVDADFNDGQMEAGSDDIDETGHVERLVLEGIYLSTSGDGFDIAVVHRGLVHVSVPTGMVLPELKPGDQVVVAVTVSASGKFSFVKGLAEGHARTEPPSSEAYAFGPLAERSSFSVGVRREDSSILRCAVPAGLDLSFFRLGDRVKLYCGLREGRLVMKKMASDRASVTGDGLGELMVEGTLTESSGDAAAVRVGDGVPFRCLNRAHLDLTPFVLGERALMGCRLGGGESRLFKLRSEHGSVYAGTDVQTEVSVYGMVTEKSTSLAVRSDDGTSKACSVPQGLDLQGFRMGERVRMRCHLTSGSYALVEVVSENASANADGTGELTAYGTLFYKTAGGLAVRREDNSVVTCHAPANANFDPFPLGTRVKVHCRRHDGSYWLSQLDSETAHLTLES